MYGKGNYASQVAQVSPVPMLPFQQRPLPYPSPPLQQGLPAVQPSMTQTPPAISLHVGYSDHFVYQYAPPPPVQQGRPVQVPTSGMLNTAQSYLPPPPPPPPPQQLHGNTPVANSYPTAQLNNQWTQNMHHTSPPPPPLGPPPIGPRHPEMFRPLITPRVLPILPSQGQTQYPGPIHLSQPGSLQGIQQIPCPRPPPPPPPLPTSSLFTPAPFGSLVHSAHQDSQVPAVVPMPPPPPPSSPPPIPPSPPPPTSPLPSCETLSSKPLLAAPDLFHNSESGPISNCSGFKVTGSDSMDNVMVTVQIKDDATACDDYENPEGRTSCEVGSYVKGNLSSIEGTKLELPRAPSKPTEEKVVQNIEVLCHCPSTQTNCLMDADVSHSPSDSDMDVEDDIIQPDEEQHVYNALEGQNCETFLTPKELDTGDQLGEPHNVVEYQLAKDAVCGLSGLAEQEKGSKYLTDHDHFTHGKTLSTVDSLVTISAGGAVFPSSSDMEKSHVPSVEGLSQSNASAAVSGFISEKFAGKLIEGASPFRLIQGYVSDDSSDDDDKHCLEDVGPVKVSPSTTFGPTSLLVDTGSNLQRDPGSKSLSISKMGSGPLNALEFFPESQMIDKEANITSISTIKTEEHIDDNCGNLESIDNAVSPEAFQQKDILDGVHDAALETRKSEFQKEDVKDTSTLPKVDGFGRLVREGASDSDFEDPSVTRRHNKRGGSPHDRRRSPRRRNEKRNRSCSCSPEKQRSRSRSPSCRHGGESGGGKMRWDKVQFPECFDFLRGRCHRGAFCQHTHHDPDKGDGARLCSSKQQLVEVPPVSRTSDFQEGCEKIPLGRSVHEHEIPGSSFCSLKDENLDTKKILVSVQDAVQTKIFDRDDKSLVTDVAKSERSGDVTAVVQETQDIKDEILELESTTEFSRNEKCVGGMGSLQNIDGPLSHLPKLLGDTSYGVASSIENLVIPQSEANPFTPQLPGEPMQPTSTFPSPPPLMENCPSYQAPRPLLQNQHSQYAVPPNTTWSPSLPLQLPFINHSTVTSTTSMLDVPSLQFKQNELPRRNNFTSQMFVRPYPPQLPAHSQVGVFQHHSYPLLPEQEAPQSFSHAEAFRPKHLPISQPFGRTGLVGEDNFSRFPVGGLSPPNSSALGNKPLQPVPSLRDSSARRMQSFPGDNLPSDEFSASSSQIHLYLQQQQSHYGPQWAAGDGISVNMGDYGNINSNMSRYASDLLGKNWPSYLSHFGGSRISNHFNPYASTFDQPLNSKFRSNVFKQEKDMPYNNIVNASFSSSHVAVDEQHVGSLSLKHMNSLPKPAQTADLPKSGNEQYDPLYDSIEPSSNSLKKLDRGQMLEHSLRFSSSCKPLDVEENNKQKGAEAVAITTSIKSENDEYGETADVEVENASASNQPDEANTAVGEIEIDQVKMPGKSKKNKDSRSTKLFKAALADVVKDMLKPKWREGAMSKEAFKTIVKKTVDRVSGAMKSHHMPKSEVKINRYIDSSQQKLRKLVTGYFDKYAKR